MYTLDFYIYQKSEIKKVIAIKVQDKSQKKDVYLIFVDLLKFKDLVKTIYNQENYKTEKDIFSKYKDPFNTDSFELGAVLGQQGVILTTEHGKKVYNIDTNTYIL